LLEQTRLRIAAAFYQGNLSFYAGYLALNEVRLEFEGGYPPPSTLSQPSAVM
jgi:hypothetical protein